jgi:2-keto-4-pentenoate hydratase/2-oxohepta-3-ene-1,7-dioic acid hydratase in catechol pathway
MQFVTFVRKGQPTLGLLSADGWIIDVADVNRRYLKGGSAPFLNGMLEFIEGGAKALNLAKKAAQYVSSGDGTRLRKLARIGAVVQQGRVRLLSPIPSSRKNVMCLGINYQEHIDEGARARQITVNTPEAPVYFTKPATSIIGHQGKVIHHKATQRLDYEVELAVVMGKKGKDIPKEKAFDYIFGYTICLDMTARDLQRRHGQWFKGKALDTFCPLGPSIVHKSALTDPHNLRLICRVNGEVMQDGNTRDMIFDIPTTIESLSAGMTLEPGDIISTGTPSGVGFARVPPLFLKPGDRVEGEVEGVGTLQVEIAAP